MLGWFFIILEWPPSARLWDPGLLIALDIGEVRSFHYGLEILEIHNRSNGVFDDGGAFHTTVFHHTLLWKDWMWKMWMQCKV